MLSLEGAEHFKLVGSYVSTPLNWAVVCGKDAPYSDIKQLEGKPIGISRIGSGSQIMASVLALQHWSSTSNLEFKVLNSFENLRNAVNRTEAAFFMWEWYTTKPFVDSSEVKFVGNVPTPWPSWSIAASKSNVSRSRDDKLTNSIRTGPDVSSDQVQRFLERLSTYTTAFDSKESRQQANVDFISKHFGYDEQDIRAWQDAVGYYHDTSTIHEKVVRDTLKTLQIAGVVQEPQEGWHMERFANSEVGKVV